MILRSSHSGYAFLVTVLVMGVVAAGAVTTLLLLNTSVLRNTVTLMSASRAQRGAMSCAERAIQSLRANLGYSGNETLTLTDGSTCKLLAIGGSGNTSRTICAEAEDSGVIRRTELTVSAVLPKTTIARWRDVPDFSLCAE